MEEQKTFYYQYSAAQNKEVESIRKKYLPKEPNKLERLRRLDARVQNAGMVQSLSLGIAGCLVFGLGMCFGLNVLTGATWLSIPFGILGVALMLPAYPVYRMLSKKAKDALTPEILKLSDELIKH